MLKLGYQKMLTADSEPMVPQLKPGFKVKMVEVDTEDVDGLGGYFADTEKTDMGFGSLNRPNTHSGDMEDVTQQMDDMGMQ